VDGNILQPIGVADAKFLQARAPRGRDGVAELAPAVEPDTLRVSSVSRAKTPVGGTARARNPRSSETEAARSKQGSSKADLFRATFPPPPLPRFLKTRLPERRCAATGSQAATDSGAAPSTSTRR
jgi:hypothetical protein